MKPPVDVTYRIDFLAGGAGRTETPPAFYPCYLVQHDNGWAIYTPLRFIPMEEQHD
jgi:hypothetical protein